MRTPASPALHPRAAPPGCAQQTLPQGLPRRSAHADQPSCWRALTVPGAPFATGPFSTVCPLLRVLKANPVAHARPWALPDLQGSSTGSSGPVLFLHFGVWGVAKEQCKLVLPVCHTIQWPPCCRAVSALRPSVQPHAVALLHLSARVRKLVQVQ